VYGVKVDYTDVASGEKNHRKASILPLQTIVDLGNSDKKIQIVDDMIDVGETVDGINNALVNSKRQIDVGNFLTRKPESKYEGGYYELVQKWITAGYFLDGGLIETNLISDELIEQLFLDPELNLMELIDFIEIDLARSDKKWVFQN